MIIPLNIKFDLDEAREYFHTVDGTYPHLRYTPDENATNTEVHKVNGFYGYGIQSNLEDLTKPCPPYHIHKNGSDIYRNTVLVFGFAKKLIDFFPNVRQLGIAVHPPGVEIAQHIDNDEFYKIHIPLYTNNSSYFSFGKEKNVMLPGKMYLVETKYMHGTTNIGESNRVHILFKLHRSTFNDVLNLTGSL
jgi:hypothetical protein